MADNQSAELTPLFSREQGENAFAKALNLFVGRGKRYSSVEVSKGSGVSHRLIDCFRNYPPGHVDHRRLDMGDQLSIISFIGSDLSSEWLKNAGQVAFGIPDGMDFDEYENRARGWLRLKGEAHHPASPDGRELSECEKQALAAGAVELKAVP